MQKKVPTLKRHKRSGRSYAWIDGKQRWFGPHDDSETHLDFLRTLAEWKSACSCVAPKSTCERSRRSA